MTNFMVAEGEGGGRGRRRLVVLDCGGGRVREAVVCPDLNGSDIFGTIS